MKSLKHILCMFIVAVFMLSAVGCAKESEKVSEEVNKEESSNKEETVNKDESANKEEVATDEGASKDPNVFVISGVTEEPISFTLEEVMSFEPYEKETKRITSKEEVLTSEIVGTPLNVLLESKGYSTENCTSIRIVASDGYEIAVPADVIENKEIIIAYQEDGEKYEKFGAFRTVIPDVRAMYWVKGTVEMVFEYSETVSSKIKQTIFLENIGDNVPLEDYEYYDSIDKALSIDSLINKYSNIEDAISGAFVASDGLETEQTVDVLKTGYIKMTGENTPLFISPTMPKGMQVKGVQYLNVGDTCFSSLAILCEKEIGLQTVLKDLGMTATSYVAMGTDGSETVLEGTAISESTFVLEDGHYYLVNTEDSIKIEVTGIKEQ